MKIATEKQIKGRAFEEYVLSLFPLRSSKDTIQLVEWQGDRFTHGIYAEANRYPDAVLRVKLNQDFYFAVECKWRAGFYNNKVVFCSREKLDIYRYFSEYRQMPVFVIMGIGGSPSCPERLFVIPLEKIGLTYLTESFLVPFERNTQKSLFYNVKEQVLK